MSTDSENILEIARGELFRSEREASRADAQSADVQVEQRDWESTLEDGID